MSIFQPPSTEWCPDCARERLDCAHSSENESTERFSIDG